SAVLDSLIVCKFLRGVFPDLMAEGAQMLAAVTGWDVSPAELAQAGARIVTAKKLFNVREGWSRDEDTLPDRFLEEPLGGTGQDGRFRLRRDELERMIGAYYAAHGWTDAGD